MCASVARHLLARGRERCDISRMRLLRALAHVVFALAIAVGALAQAHAAAAMVVAVAPHHGQEDASLVAHADHDHGAPAKAHPVHKRDACQTACCLMPAQQPARVGDASIVGFFCAVRYVEKAQAGSGLHVAPDPGIPKLVA